MGPFVVDDQLALWIGTLYLPGNQYVDPVYALALRYKYLILIVLSHLA